MQARQRVPDRFGESALFRQQRRLRPRARCAKRRRLAWSDSDESQAAVQATDRERQIRWHKVRRTAQRFRRDRRVRGLRHVVELSSRVAPVCGEHDVPFLRQWLEPGIAVDMKNAAEALKMRGRMFSFAVRRTQVDRSRRLGSAPCSLLAGVHPKPSRLGAPSTWIEHRHGRVIGEQTVRREHVPGETLVQRLEPPAGSADPSGERRTRKIDPVAGEDFAPADTRACDRNIC